MAKKLVLKKLTILATTEKSGNQFTFGNGINLITSSENSVGKSSLIKSILSSFGAEPFYDKRWRDLQCNYLIEFCIADKHYKIARLKNEFYLSNDSNKFYYDNFKDFSKKISELLNFNPILKTRGDDYIYDIAPPAYYFISFYIDQIKGWAKAFSSLDKLGQYESWHNPILDYHVGLTNSNIMNFKLKISEYKKLNHSAERKKEKVLDSITLVRELLADRVSSFENEILNDKSISTTTKSLNNSAIIQPSDNSKLSNIDELNEVKKLYEETLNIRKEKYDQLALVKENLIEFKNQSKFINSNIIELQNDYYFSVESLDDVVECPLCGVSHNNTLENRTDILLDADKLNNLLSEVNLEIETKEKNASEIKKSIQLLDNQLLEYDNSINSFNSFEDTINFYSNQIIEDKSQRFISKQIEIIGENTISIASLEDDLKKLEESIDKKSINNSFKEAIQYYSNKLSISIPDQSIPSFKQYSKYEKNGGAADSARSLLMYYLSLYSVISKYSDEVISPLFIDTPNQQEQSVENYLRILNSFKNDLPNDTQLFLGAMEHPLIDEFKESCSKIYVLQDYQKLLNTKNYDNLLTEFNSYISTFA
ncbi:hypothetical protein [Acinetobacter sp. YH01026]|uniref:hypothetical protein n=1 Tax=Acinetobacter sp. YH01026 TaxID=2601039 RepID=UPI0015D335EC|nr:hypothetical protein [Acinetobacter sp. YH01026]